MLAVGVDEEEAAPLGADQPVAVLHQGGEEGAQLALLLEPLVLVEVHEQQRRHAHQAAHHHAHRRAGRGEHAHVPQLALRARQAGCRQAEPLRGRFYGAAEDRARHI